MNEHERRQICELVQGRCRPDLPLARFSTYGVGGPADLLVEPADPHDLALLLPHCAQNGIPLLVLGGGSNMLVADAGFRGAVVRLSARPFQAVELLPKQADTPRLRLGGGLRVSRLMGQAARNGWPGLAFLEGIPGTVGGCVRMNAGTREGELKDILVEATLVLQDGRIERRDRAACGFAYRRSSLPVGAVVTEALVDAGQEQPEHVRALLRRHHQHRKRTQPIGRNGGSVFKNPPGDHAGRLIEAAGCKELKVGGARVSELHANFISTEPGASADDVYRLIQRVREEVDRQHGLQLELENILIGFEP